MRYKLVKKSKNKIKCLRDENTGVEIQPGDIGLTDNLTEHNVSILEKCLDNLQRKEVKVGLFDLLKDINFDKSNLIEGNDDKYVPFIINKMLSLHQDCLHQANEMNIRPDIPKLAQYKYLCNSVRKRKRFSKVPKFTADEDALLLSKFYNISIKKAQQYLEIIYLELGEIPENYKKQYKLYESSST